MDDTEIRETVKNTVISLIQGYGLEKEIMEEKGVLFPEKKSILFSQLRKMTKEELMFKVKDLQTEVKRLLREVEDWKREYKFLRKDYD